MVETILMMFGEFLMMFLQGLVTGAIALLISAYA